MPGAGVPLGQRKRFEAEHSLKTALRAGGNLKGAIFFVYIRERFEYIPSHGYLETPLEEQCPMMKLLTESLGPKRAHEHTIKVKNDEPGFLCKLFTRVMKGCSKIQIAGVLSYLNGEFLGIHMTYYQIKYGQLMGLARDVVEPRHKYMTRKRPEQPYLWHPFDFSGATQLTEQDIVHNGRKDVIVALEAPIPVSGEQDAQQQQPDDHDEAEQGDQHEAAADSDDEATLQNVRASSPAPKQAIVNCELPTASAEQVGHEAARDVDCDEFEGVGDEQNEENGDKQPAEGGDDADKVEASEQPGVMARQTSVASSGHDNGEHKECDPGTSKSQCPPDVPEVRQVPVESEDMFAGGDVSEEEPENDAEPENEANSDLASENDCNSEEEQEQLPECNALAVDVPPSVIPPKIGQTFIDKDPDRHMFGQDILENAPKPLDEHDKRSPALRILHEKLPRSVVDIPNMAKAKIALTGLVIEVNKWERKYLRVSGSGTEIAKIDENKTLNQREATREVKHIKELMQQRDKWLREHTKKVEAARVKIRKAENSKSGKLAKRRELEAKELARLEKVARTKKGPALPAPIVQHETSFLANTEHVTNLTGVEMHLNKILTTQTQSQAQAELQNVTMGSMGGMSSIPHAMSIAHSMTTDKEANPDNTQSVMAKVQVTNKAQYRADTVNLLSEMSGTLTRLWNKTLEQDKKINDLVKTSNNEIKATKQAVTKNTAKVRDLQHSFDAMKKAFHEYDVRSHQQLNDAQQEFLAYLPLDTLGPKADFIFSDPNLAKTIAKFVFSQLGGDGINQPDLIEVVHKTIKKCFTGKLRAHLHITRKLANENRDMSWDKRAVPQSFIDFYNKYVNPIMERALSSKNEHGWRQKLYTHFNTTRVNYFGMYAVQSKQSVHDFVVARYHEKAKLHEMHPDPSVDVAKEPPTLDEEIQTYLANSRYYKTVEEMKAAPSTKVKATKFETDAGDPLPDLATLKAMADNLGKLYAVSVSTTAKTKYRMGNNMLSDSFEPSPDTDQLEVEEASSQADSEEDTDEAKDNSGDSNDSGHFREPKAKKQKLDPSHSHSKLPSQMRREAKRPPTPKTGKASGGKIKHNVAKTFESINGKPKKKSKK